MSKLVIGLGTGRSGTWSLTKLLQVQKNAACTHEGYFMRWRPDHLACFRAIAQMMRCGAKYVCDVGFYWINYIDDVLDAIPDARFICMERNRELVINSFDSRTPFNNYWTDTSSKHWSWEKYEFAYLNPAFPSFDLPKREAIGAYWDLYRRKVLSWSKLYPKQFHILDIEMLNDESGQELILDLAGIDKDDQVIQVGEWHNKNRNIVMDMRKFHEYDRDKVTKQIGLCGNCEKNPPTTIITNKTYNMSMHVCDDCVEISEKKLKNHFTKLGM